MIVKLTEKSIATLPRPTTTAQLYVWDDELVGFGAVLGATGSVTFIVRGRIARAPGARTGRRVKVTIGALGRPCGEGTATWNVRLARQAAKIILGRMARGEDPHGERRARASGPTLRDGLALHTSNMAKRGRARRSIATISAEVPRHLGAWLDRPICELRGADLVAEHERLSATGRYVANRIVAHVSTIWNALDRVHELPGRNPARAVERHAYRPKREVIDDLRGWWTRVQTLTPVRRDLRLFALFTGMRDEAARQARWEHFDVERGVLLVPRPKGGEARAFTLPLAPGVVAMLVARRAENAAIYAAYGGDGGWIFPSVSRDGLRVIPVAESKERRGSGPGTARERFLPGMHASRRTFLTVATEAGVSEIDRHVLANHAYGRQSVNATYIAQSLEHLSRCAARIEAALLERMGVPQVP